MRYQSMPCVTVLVRIGGVIQEIIRRVICVTLVHPAVYGEIRPDIAHIRLDIIRPDVVVTFLSTRVIICDLRYIRQCMEKHGRT